MEYTNILETNWEKLLHYDAVPGKIVSILSVREIEHILAQVHFL